MFKKMLVSLVIVSGICFETSAGSPSNQALQAEIDALKIKLNQLESKVAHNKKSTGSQVKQDQTMNNAVWRDKKIHFSGITITPGGFFAGEGVWRSRGLQSDIASAYNFIPLGNNPLAYMNELRFSARQSRVSALVEGNVNSELLLSGYGEMDFLGNGTANQNETNSFNPRLRNLYTAVDYNDFGWHVLAGQSWSLVTTYFNGLMPRNELIPTTIDAQYVVGFVWKRQPQFRLTKNFGKTFWAAISLENPQTTFGGLPLPGNGINPIYNDVVNITYGEFGVQSLPDIVRFSLNHVPDVIVKLAFEPTIDGHKLHLEGFGLYRDFYDQVQYLYNVHRNKDTAAGGVGGGLVYEVIPKRLDIQGNILAGKGIGSYASGLLPDATINSDGSLAAIPEVEFMFGGTVHATPTLDWYVFGGSETETATFFTANNQNFGYGVPNANNLGCTLVNIGICLGTTHNLWQVTTGLWDKFYQGAYGDLRAGLQYSYTVRSLFASNDEGLTLIPHSPTVNEHMVFFSLRYYPFTMDNVAPG